MSTQTIRPTRNSLATLIAWVSTCLLAGGVGVSFSESLRALWMWWGSFGLAAAFGLEAVARIHKQKREQLADRGVRQRSERGLQDVAQATETIAAIRRAVTQVIGDRQHTARQDITRRGSDRQVSEYNIEVLLRGDALDAVEPTKVAARLNDISYNGFGLTLARPLRPQQVLLLITLMDGTLIRMLGEIRWCDSHDGGLSMAGGRLLRVVPHD